METPDALGIIAGNGVYPLLLAQSARKAGIKKIVAAAFTGETSAELAQAVDPRLSSAEDEVDTVGGLVFLLAGHIPTKGECVSHPSGWTFEALDSDPRRIIRVRLHAPDREVSPA